MQTVIDNILLNYEVLGSKNDKTILILHGWRNSIKNWENIAKNLSVSNKIVLVDLPGMGNSSLPKKVFNTYDYANIINKFILKLNLKHILLIGHSFGGKISIVIASQNSNIDKLILVDPSGINKKTLKINLKIFLAKFLKLIIPKKNLAFLASDDYKNAGNLLPIFKNIVKEDVSESAKKIKIPTLIIWGENDKEVPLSSGVKLKNIISNSTLRIVWKAGHHPHIDKPDKFLEIIYEYI